MMTCDISQYNLYRIAQNFDREILMDTDCKYLAENILTDLTVFHYTPVNAVLFFKQFYG